MTGDDDDGVPIRRRNESHQIRFAFFSRSLFSLFFIISLVACFGFRVSDGRWTWKRLIDCFDWRRIYMFFFCVWVRFAFDGANCQTWLREFLLNWCCFFSIPVSVVNNQMIHISCVEFTGLFWLDFGMEAPSARSSFLPNHSDEQVWRNAEILCKSLGGHPLWPGFGSMRS